MLRQLYSKCCEVSAPAKLNLFLEVLGKRPDGYHELETLMVRVSLFDTLRLTDNPSGELSLRSQWAVAVDPPTRVSLPRDSQNLVLKAASLLKQETGTSMGASIELLKRIPLAAGLAGGSSDAAAALVGLNHLWKLNLSSAELQQLGARLGSDVPFFVANSSAAVCRGRGEVIEPVRLASTLHFVIVKPAAGLSTAAVFQNCRPSQSAASVQDLVQAMHLGDLGRAGSLLFNRLSEPAAGLCPQVEELNQRFAVLPVCGHQMSGSGTSCFGWTRHRDQARQIAGRLRSANCGHVFVVQSCV